ncbi:AKA10-like protein [Mya arenaria]|uniref:AKA10-like protein n=1 Tax=Mya arenaria TaxID=6604 RepID=A0ABY7E332_MYAAR|nr:AKA10-like protein [Mya arenaria]
MSFFRRKSEKKNDKTKSTSASETKKAQAHMFNETTGFDNEAGSANRNLLLLQDEFHPGDLGVSLNPEGEYRKESKLWRGLDATIHDHEAVPYLIQYLESCKASQLIRFWLDAESFQASTWTRIRTHSLQFVSKSSLIKDRQVSPSPSLTRSINKDITSPGSVDSLETGCQNKAFTSKESDSNSSNPVRKVIVENGSVKEQCASSKGVNLHTSSVESGDTSGAITVLNSNDCDCRDREKCKPGTCRKNLDLPLQNCDNSASNETVSAISYRDLATPSPPTEGQPTVHSKTDQTTSSLAEKLKKSVEQDAVRIFTKYLAQEATHPIGINDDLRNNTISKICREDGQVDPECFAECQKFAIHKIEEKYFADYKESVYHCKYQVDVLTGGKLHINDVIYNEQALFYFMEYLEQEGLCDLLQFLIAMDNYHDLLSHSDSYSGDVAQNDAMVIYDKYFSLQASVPLGFPDAVRFEVEGNICREEGPLPDCFARPRHIVLHTLEKRHFQQYLTSDIYYKYLSELVSAVQTAQDFPLGQTRKRRGSESSSEHSVGGQSVTSEKSMSSRNTLLASGTSRPMQLSRLEENMRNMDLDDTLLNPDRLWERKHAGGMSLGQIDILGQFVSRFDPDPESQGTSKNKPSGGARFFKSKKDKEKEKEEMARKVAEMILKDVASVNQAIEVVQHDEML